MPRPGGGAESDCSKRAMSDHNQPLLDHSAPHSYTNPPESPRKPGSVHGSTRGSVRGSIAGSVHPDSPQIHSPQDAPSVRYYRYLLYTFTAALAVAALALSVDAFSYLGLSSPQGPGLDTLGVVWLTLASMLVSLWFYSIPSYIDQVICLMSCLLLLIDLVVLLAVPELRHRQGQFGAIALLGGIFSFFVGGYANVVVKSAKITEDIRIFGHYDDRKTLGEWFKYFALNLTRLLIFAAVLLLTANISIDAADSNLQPLGGIYPVDLGDATLNIHVACSPAGSGPLVLVESGGESGEESAKWALGAKHIGTICYWDRPGRGFSDNAPSPLAVGQTVDILMDALELAHPGYRNESAVLVSSGVGSLYSRVLAAKLGKSLEGMMLVDGVHEELFYDTWGIFKSFYHFCKGVTMPMRPTKVMSVFKSYSGKDRIFGRLESESARYQKALMQELYSSSRQSRRDIGDATLALPHDVPLLVVSSSERCKDTQWSTYQRLLLKLSSNVVAWKIIDGPAELWKGSKSAKELTELLEMLAKSI